MENLDQLREELLASVTGAETLDALEEIRVSALGRKGRVTELMKGLGGLDPEERRAAGQGLNAVKTAVTEAIEARPIWKPMHLQPVFERCHCRGGAVAADLFARGLFLPSGSALSDEDRERIKWYVAEVFFG